MCKAGRKITSGIDGITGGATKRHANRNDQAGYRNGSQAAHTHLGSVAGCGEAEDDEHQHEGADCLTEEIPLLVGNGRDGAEGGKHNLRLV